MKNRPTEPIDRIFAGVGIVFLALLLLAVLATAAGAHEGEHPLRCEEVDVPDGAHCHQPGDDHPLPKTIDDSFHPTCIIERPGVGSAAATPVRVECLPDTGTSRLPLAILAGALMAGGAAALILTSEPDVDEEPI